MKDFISHIRAVVYRNLIWAFRSPFRLVDIFIWPLVLLFTLTFFFTYVGGEQSLLNLLILSVIAWRVIFYVSFETTALFIEETWTKSLSSILVSPISMLEIALGGAFTGVLKTILVIIILLSIGFLFYDLQIPDPALFTVAVLFQIVFGFSIGFILFGLACYFSKRNVFTFSFMLPELIGLISGPYYSISDVFPAPLISVLNLLPSVHAFNLIKSTMGFGEVDYTMLVFTSILWVAIALIVNKIFYELGRKKGTITRLS